MTDRDPNTGRFVSGVSGNPKGRPLSIAGLIDECVTPEDWKAMATKLKVMGMHGNIKAIELLLDRRFGKAVQDVNMNQTGEVRIIWDYPVPPSQPSSE